MSSSILAPISVVAEYLNSLNAEYNALSYEELKKMSVWQRAQAYNWSFELGSVLILAVLALFHVVGSNVNVKRANKIFEEMNDYFRNGLSFARVGFNSGTTGVKEHYVAESQNTWFSTFATGRSAIESITMKVHMYPRSNPLSLGFEKVLGYFFPSLALHDYDEFCEVVIKPNGIYAASETAAISTDVNSNLNKFKFVTSVVNKSVMNDVRENNYFFSLTHTSENEKLPIEFVYMSEMNQLNGFFNHYSSNFSGLLRDNAKFLQYISFTDLPSVKPETQEAFAAAFSPRCIIRTNVPTSSADIKALQSLVSATVSIFDDLTREIVQNSTAILLSPDILRKTNNLRTQEAAKILKEQQQLEKELALEQKQEAEREKRRKLKGSAEQQKQDQKMKEKRERRQRNKQRMRI